MEQDIFRDVYKEMHARECLFQKAILSFLCHCSHSHKTCIAEREGIRCKDDAAQQQCAEFLLTIKEKARFSLKSATTQNLSHSSNLRLQIGSLRGVRALFNPKVIETEKIADIYTLISQARMEFKQLERLPFDKIIPYIGRYEGRRKRKKPRH